jgi:uncharacterized protein (DUF2141 family)
MVLRILGIVLALVLSSESTYAQETTKSGTITITITKLRNIKGFVLGDLFASKAGFPDNPKKALANLRSVIRGDKSVFVFKKVKYGSYALSFLHDENNDKDLETTWYGKPQEGVCTSGNAEKKSSTTPEFKDAVFKFNQPHLKLKVTMTYYD